MILATLAQMSTAFLDLIGVLLIGAVAALSVSVMSHYAPPALVQTMLDRLGIGGSDTTNLAFGLAVVAAIVLITKSAINSPVRKLHTLSPRV